MYQTPLEGKRKEQHSVQDMTAYIALHYMSHATRRKRPTQKDETVRQQTTPAVNTSLLLLLVSTYMSRCDLLESLSKKTIARSKISGFHGGEDIEFYLVGYYTVSRAGGYQSYRRNVPTENKTTRGSSETLVTAQDILRFINRKYHILSPH